MVVCVGKATRPGRVEFGRAGSWVFFFFFFSFYFLEFVENLEMFGYKIAYCGWMVDLCNIGFVLGL